LIRDLVIQGRRLVKEKIVIFNEYWKELEVPGIVNIFI
jgi:hypothetical protein